MAMNWMGGARRNAHHGSDVRLRLRDAFERYRVKSAVADAAKVSESHARKHGVAEGVVPARRDGQRETSAQRAHPFGAPAPIDAVPRRAPVVGDVWRRSGDVVRQALRRPDARRARESVISVQEEWRRVAAIARRPAHDNRATANAKAGNHPTQRLGQATPSRQRSILANPRGTPSRSRKVARLRWAGDWRYDTPSPSRPLWSPLALRGAATLPATTVPTAAAAPVGPAAAAVGSSLGVAPSAALGAAACSAACATTLSPRGLIHPSRSRSPLAPLVLEHHEDTFACSRLDQAPPRAQGCSPSLKACVPSFVLPITTMHTIVALQRRHSSRFPEQNQEQALAQPPASLPCDLGALHPRRRRALAAAYLRS